MTQVTADLTPEQRTAIGQVEKLLRLAGKNYNENEAAAATAKAQELLLKYNLDMSIVEQNSGASSGKREDTKFEGGLYHYQRDVCILDRNCEPCYNGRLIAHIGGHR